MLPTSAKPARIRQSAMLLRGADRYGNFDDEPRPGRRVHRDRRGELQRVVDARAKLIFETSRLRPSEAYGGTRPAA